jgi:hypothetical protein
LVRERDRLAARAELVDRDREVLRDEGDMRMTNWIAIAVVSQSMQDENATAAFCGFVEPFMIRSIEKASRKRSVPSFVFIATAALSADTPLSAGAVV